MHLAPEISQFSIGAIMVVPAAVTRKHLYEVPVDITYNIYNIYIVRGLFNGFAMGCSSQKNLAVVVSSDQW